MNHSIKRRYDYVIIVKDKPRRWKTYSTGFMRKWNILLKKLKLRNKCAPGKGIISSAR